MGGDTMTMRPLAALPTDIALLRRGGAFSTNERLAAERVVRAVRRDGDAAVLRLVRRFDRPAVTAGDLFVSPNDLRRAARRCPRELRTALAASYRRIRAFHARQRPRSLGDRDARLVPVPLDRVGALVPRGTVSYPSTALMTGVPAQLAGVRELVVASPMPPDGALDPGLAYALTLVEASGVYRAGGAAAVAALAYGTGRVTRVDRIVGPGNGYAAAAKWLVSADVGIDALQGPSELVVVASADADPRVLALDLLAQVEHGAGAFAALVAVDPVFLRVVAGATGDRLERVRLYRARDLGAAVRAADEAAPEHVLLAGREAAALAPRVRHAGAVFVGACSAVALGDYVVGTNHSLPTGGTARWSSPLRVEDFVRWTSRIEIRGDLRPLARAAITVAKHEGMRYHAASVEARL